MAAFFILAFILWTVAVMYIDVNEVGLCYSSVGFSAINSFIHDFTGVHMSLYIITDWLSLIPVGVILAFALTGLIQWIKRKSILKVDFNIIALGVFYSVVLTAYIIFEIFVVNYRPVLINGYPEASYPSSTTVLVLCVMSTAAIQLYYRIKNKFICKLCCYTIYSFTVFMVICRFISGVHWLSDIIGGILLSAGLVTIYYSVCMNDFKKR